MTDTRTPEQRLARLLDHVGWGYSIRLACKVCHVSQRTVWLRRRSSPEFAAALHKAIADGALIRAEEREDRYREGWAALALERFGEPDPDWDPRFPEPKDRKDWTKREKRYWYRWRGVWPNTSGLTQADIREMLGGKPKAAPQAKSEAREPKLQSPARTRAPSQEASRKHGVAKVLW
jgi:hypothetical protein